MFVSSHLALLSAAVAGLVTLLVSTSTVTADDNPFSPGTHKFGQLTFSPARDGCPLYCTMYFPLQPAVYTPIFFVGGLYDLIRTDYYSDFLKEVARHGYIVIGIDLEPKPSSSRTRRSANRTALTHTPAPTEMESVFVTQIKWLKGRIDKMTPAIPNWRKLTLSCQSASCTNILSIVRSHPSFAAAALFLDPVCMFSSGFEPVKSKTVALAYVSNKSFAFPFCCVKGMSYRRVYELMTNVKVRMSVRDFGHCGLMDEGAWKLCKETHICHVGSDTEVPQYRLFTAGIIHAFLKWTLDKNLHYRRYVTDELLMPLVLNDLAYQIRPSP